MTRDEMLTELRQRECRVIFKKVDGEERDMICTLMEDRLPEMTTKPDDKKRQPNEAVLRVWDVNKEAFRSFRVENVVSFS